MRMPSTCRASFGWSLFRNATASSSVMARRLGLAPFGACDPSSAPIGTAPGFTDRGRAAPLHPSPEEGPSGPSVCYLAPELGARRSLMSSYSSFRLWTSSFLYMLLVWVFTVDTDTNSSSAISGACFFWARRSRTSASRLERECCMAMAEQIWPRE